MDGILAGIAGGATVAITINAVDNFSKTFTKAGSSIQKIGKIAAAGALVMGAALVGIGIGAVKTAAAFETAWIGVRKTVDLTEEEFAELENRFKTLSTEIPMSFVELAHIGEIAGQLGVEGVDNIARFTKTIADISVTTNLTAEQAATDFARFANIMNMPIDQVDKLGSVVVDLGNNLATTEAEIVTMGMRIAGAGAALDMTEGEVMAWAGALSSMGVRAEMGGTAISKFMINISSMVATNSPELEKFAKVAGMTSEEFTKAFEKDASVALQTFFTGLGNVEEKGGDVLLTLENLGITEVRLRDTVLRLAAGDDTLTKALNIQDAAWEENTALVEEAEKRYGTFDSQMTILKNTGKLLLEEIGKELIPVILKMAEVFKSDVLPAITPLIPVIGEFLAKSLQRLVDLFIEVMPFLIEFIGNILETADKIMGELMPVLEELIPVLLDLGVDVFKSVSDAIIKLLPIFTKLMDDVIIPLIPQVADLITKILELVPVILDKTVPAVIGLVDSFTDLIPVIEDVLGFAADVIDFFRDVGGFFGLKGGNDFSGVLDIESYQEGGRIPKTGIYQLHKGEYVVPAPGATEGLTQGRAINYYITIDNLNGFNARDIANTLQEELNKKI